MEATDNATLGGAPLSGFRVLDLSSGVAGPHATMLMALNGADVIKLEPPEGDWSRRLGPQAGDRSVLFAAFNRGKRSLAVDLKSAEGRSIALELAATCDIVVESFRPGVMDALGMGADTLRARDPELIVLSVSGFGQTEPWRGKAGVDTLIQASSGMMAMNASPDGMPRRFGLVVVDVAAGLYAYQAVCGALIRRLRSGGGARLDIGLAQAAAALQAPKIMEYVHTDGRVPQGLYVPSGVFRTADGHLVITGIRDEHFVALCEVLGLQELVGDPRWPTARDRIVHAGELNRRFQERLLGERSRAWLERLEAVGVMAEVVQTYGEWLDSPHAVGTRACGVLEIDGFGRLPVPRIPGVLPDDRPGESDRTPPRIGEHSRELLSELGRSDDAIERALAAGTVRAPD